jgi:thymidylate kinase
LENLQAVRKKYFESFEKLKQEENIIIIDGNRSSENIFTDIWEKLAMMFNSNLNKIISR